MFSRLRSDFAYAAGLLRVVRATRVATKRPTSTLGDHLAEWAAQHGERPALVERQRILQLSRARRPRQRLRPLGGRARPRQGRRGGLMMPNRPEYVAIWFGLARAGLAVALVNTNLTGASLAHSLAIVAAKVAIVDAACRRIRSARRGGDAGLVVYGEARADGAPRLDRRDRRVRRRAARRRRAPGADDQRPRALHLHLRNDRPAEGGAHHPFARAAHHARLRRGGRRAAERPHLQLPADVSHQRRRHRAGVALAVGGSAYIRDKFSASEFWSDAIAREMHDVHLHRRILPLSHQRPPSRQGARAPHPRLRRQRPAARHLRRVPEALRHPRRAGVLRRDRRQCGDVQFRIPARRDRPHARPGRRQRFPMALVAYDVDADSRHARRRRLAASNARVDEVGELLGRNPRRSRQSRRALRRLRRRRGDEARKSCTTCSSRAMPGSAPAI